MRGSRPLLAALLPALLAADCDADPPATAPRTARIEVRVDDPLATAARSQDAGLLEWDGTSRLHLIGLHDATLLEASVHDDELGGAAPFDDVCLFFEGPSPLLDQGGESDSVGLFARTLIPGPYDLIAAPGCFVGERARQVVPDVEVEAGVTLPLHLAAREPVAGEVLDTAGRPVHGAVIVLYPADAPTLPLGVTLRTDAAGRFAASLAPGSYALTVSAEADGRLDDPDHPTLAPVVIRAVELPLPEGFTLRVRVPVTPAVALRGELLERTGTRTGGRVQLEGLVDPVPGQYGGGALRAEVASVDGTWEFLVPPGRYTVRSWPPHAGARPVGGTDILPVQDQDVAELDVVAVGGAPLDGLALRYRDSVLTTITAQEPNGSPASGHVTLHRLEAPHYTYRYPLSGGSVSVLLMAGTYSVEVLAARDPETGRRRFARAHGELDLTQGPTSVALRLPRSDRFPARVLSEDRQGVPDLWVVSRDPVSGRIVDDALTTRDGVRGYFESVAPRPAP